MTKLAIPIALIAIIMVAGVFAFVPVQTASTVHNTISDDYDSFLDLMCSTLNDGDDYNAEFGSCDDFD